MRCAHSIGLFVIVIIALAALTSVNAGQFEDAYDAYVEGNYTEALGIWKPMAGTSRGQGMNYGVPDKIGLKCHNSSPDPIDPRQCSRPAEPAADCYVRAPKQHPEGGQW